MNARLRRVEEALRRAVADALLSSRLRDPRLEPRDAISITGVRVSPDLSSACVYLDVLEGRIDPAGVLQALSGAAGTLRREVGDRVDFRRLPRLRFERDPAVAAGTRIERLLAEIHERDRPEPADEDDGDDRAGS